MEDKNWRFTWTPQSVRWYEDANACTGYNRRLAEQIRQYLKPADRVFELAAGLGCLAAELAPMVKSYTVNDMDEYALETLAQKKTDNMHIVPGDWRQACLAQAPFDVTIYQQFSGILKDWELLKSVTRRQVIAILPLGKAATPAGEAAASAAAPVETAAPRAEAATPDDVAAPVETAATPADSGAEETAADIPAHKKGHLESCAGCTAFLDEKGVSYQLIFLKMDFGQPFRSKAEADAFCRHYYALSEAHSEPAAVFEKKLQPMEHPEFKYYYPKEKEIGILIASTEE